MLPNFLNKEHRTFKRGRANELKSGKEVERLELEERQISCHVADGWQGRGEGRVVLT